MAMAARGGEDGGVALVEPTAAGMAVRTLPAATKETLQQLTEGFLAGMTPVTDQLHATLEEITWVAACALPTGGFPRISHPIAHPILHPISLYPCVPLAPF
jgi:hypothetical protein